MDTNNPDSGAIREGEPSYYGNASRGKDTRSGSETRAINWKAWFILGAIAVFFAVAASSMIYTIKSRRSTPHFHNEAAKKFFEYVRACNSLNIEGKQVQKAFDECFVDGLPVAEIDDLLKTGFKSMNGQDIEYRWSFSCEYNGHLEGFVLILVVAESTSHPGYWYVKERTGSTLPS